MGPWCVCGDNLNERSSSASSLKSYSHAPSRKPTAALDETTRYFCPAMVTTQSGVMANAALVWQ